MSLDKKNKIIEQSKELFSRFGYNKTKLSDIAKSVGYVKSAIYYYFSGKEEIFEELVRIESASLLKKLNRAINKETTSENKLYTYINERINIMSGLSKRYHFLKEEFFELIPIVEQQRKPYDLKEIELIIQILEELNNSGLAKIENTTFTATLLMQNLKGLEIQMFVTDAIKTHETNRDAFINFLLHGVLNNK